jgi:hypothetical protein
MVMGREGWGPATGLEKLDLAYRKTLRIHALAGLQWLTPVILAIWEDRGSKSAQANSL